MVYFMMNITEPYKWKINIVSGNRVRQQAITWSKTKLVLWRRMDSLGHSGLNDDMMRSDISMCFSSTVLVGFKATAIYRWVSTRQT